MEEFYGTCDALTERVQEAERDKSKWLPIGDIIVENLHEQLTYCKVATSTVLLVAVRSCTFTVFVAVCSCTAVKLVDVRLSTSTAFVALRSLTSDVTVAGIPVPHPSLQA